MAVVGSDAAAADRADVRARPQPAGEGVSTRSSITIAIVVTAAAFSLLSSNGN